ncbi:hypothetical protein [Streptomyces sp. NPDC006193]|uniref:hypothetical protein n=1 Tax=Streptomyces sp. NPDC006193 TaxID=3155717 RepID=UPI0033B84CA6
MGMKDQFQEKAGQWQEQAEEKLGQAREKAAQRGRQGRQGQQPERGRQDRQPERGRPSGPGRPDHREVPDTERQPEDRFDQDYDA